MSFKSGLAPLCIGLVAAASSAHAATTRSFPITPLSVTLDTSNLFANGTMGIPDATSDTYVNFVLPADYVLNSVANLRLYFSTPNAPCGISFGAALLGRSRPGAVRSVVSSPGIAAGLSGGAMATISFNKQEAVVVKTMNLQAPTAGTLVGQKAGDGIQLVLRRAGADSGDTCPGPVELNSIEVRYSSP